MEMLDAAFGDDFDHRVRAFASYARPMALRSGRTVAVAALEDLPRQEYRPAYVLHYAYLGKEKVAELGVAAFAETNKAINDLVEGYCAKLPGGGMFFASSGAAHYAGGSAEDSAREPYGAAKIRDEERFMRLTSAEFSVAVCRIFNMAGPFMNKLDDYALGSILVDIQNGGGIKLRANKAVVRSYVHVRDVVNLALYMLLNHKAPSRPFDAAGDETIEIGALAVRAMTLLGCANISIVRPPLAINSEDRYLGDGEIFRTLLADAGLQPIPLNRQILDTAEYLRSVRV